MHIRERRIQSRKRERSKEPKDVPTYWDLAAAMHYVQPTWTDPRMRACSREDETWDWKYKECFHSTNLDNYDRLVKGAYSEIWVKLRLFCGKKSPLGGSV